jgi:hypothetical protein
MFTGKMLYEGFQQHYSFIRPALNCLSIYFIWAVIHYTSVHLYSMVCAPLSVKGFVMAAFLVPSPHCEALGWVIYNGSLTSRAMWVMLGCYISSKLELKKWV